MSQTIRVSSPISDDNQSGFVVINAADFVTGQHEPFGDEDLEVLRNAPNVAADSILSSAGQLEVIQSIDQMRAELDAEAGRIRAKLAAEHDRLSAMAIEIEARTSALDVEAARLEALAASLESKSDEANTHMTAAQLKEALTARGIEFKANASKTDLQNLLDAA